MVVVVGDTDKLAAAEVCVAPTAVVKFASEYHCQTAPVPKEPPVWVSVVLPPLQIVAVEALNEVGATEGWLTVIVTTFELAEVQTPLVTTAL